MKMPITKNNYGENLKADEESHLDLVSHETNPQSTTTQMEQAQTTLKGTATARKSVHSKISAFVFVFALFISGYFTFVTAPAPVWFHLHPLLCSLGMYACCSYAI